MPSNYKAEDLKKSQNLGEKLNQRAKSKPRGVKLESDKTQKGNSSLKKEESEKAVLFETADKLASPVKNKLGRNPITGEGCPEGKQKISCRKRDGNPVLGTGYDIKTQKLNKMPVGGKSTILIT